ncbi:MAG: hypothetical protein IJQ63_12625, partial [Synergistaceae bacterium]|nr:hypothetical protein [Synergistaceae bacterium]
IKREEAQAKREAEANRLDDLAKKLAEREAKLSESEKEFADKESALNARAKELDELEAKVNSHADELNNLEAGLKSKGEELDKKAEEINNRDKVLAGKESEFKTRAERVAARENLLDEIPGFNPDTATESTIMYTFGLAKAERDAMKALHDSAMGKFRNNRITQAYDEFSKAAELQPRVNYLSAYWAAAAAERLRNRRGDAVNWVNKALAINPNYKPAQDLKKRLEAAPKAPAPAPAPARNQRRPQQPPRRR